MKMQARTRDFEAQSLCSAQDLRVLWMLEMDRIKIQFQTPRSRAMVALATSLQTDAQLPCRQMVPLTLLPSAEQDTCTTAAACRSIAHDTSPPDNATLSSPGTTGQIVVWIFDDQGRGLEGKSVHLWVKPDLPDYMDESVLFQPGNARVGVRAAALQELGGGAYLFDDRAGEGGEGGEEGSPFLWATLTDTLPGGEDGRYGQEGAGCGNCSNAPFAYSFVADGVRLPTVPCVCGGGEGGSHVCVCVCVCVCA